MSQAVYALTMLLDVLMSGGDGFWCFGCGGWVVVEGGVFRFVAVVRFSAPLAYRCVSPSLMALRCFCTKLLAYGLCMALATVNLNLDLSLILAV